METINNTNLKVLRDEMKAALAEIAAKHGLEITLSGSMTYNDSEFSCKINGTVVGKMTRSDVLLEMYAKQHNLTLEPQNGKVLIKYNSRAKSMPWIYEENGMQYKCDLNTARRYFTVK